MKSFSTAETCSRLAALAGPHAGGHGGPHTGQHVAGQVHSVFPRAVNIGFYDILVCFLSAGAPLHPYSAVLAEALNFETLGLAPGQSAVLGDACIGIDLKNTNICFSFQDAKLYDLSLDAHSTGLCAPGRVPEKLDALARVIAESPDAEEGLAPLLGLWAPGRFPALPQNRWCHFLFPRVRALPALLHTGDVDTLTEAGRKLAGCGPGLTPSSDDFLVGLCAALFAAQAAGLWPAARGAASALANGAAAATGAISAAGLAHAGQGLFSRDMLRLLELYFSKDEDSIKNLPETAQRVAAFGSTSGPDTLAGLWFGLVQCNGLSF